MGTDDFSKEGAEMPNKVEVQDLSFLTLLALQEADCFRRREETEGRYLAALCVRLDDILDLDGAGLQAMVPSTVLTYARSLKAATGVDYKGGLAELASGLRKQLASIKEIVAKNAAGAAHEIGPGTLRPAMAFLRSLHEQLLVHKQREAAKRATRSVLRQRE
jgi:hypothetical protein